MFVLTAWTSVLQARQGPWSLEGSEAAVCMQLPCSPGSEKLSLVQQRHGLNCLLVQRRLQKNYKEEEYGSVDLCPFPGLQSTQLGQSPLVTPTFAGWIRLTKLQHQQTAVQFLGVSKRFSFTLSHLILVTTVILQRRNRGHLAPPHLH